MQLLTKIFLSIASLIYMGQSHASETQILYIRHGEVPGNVIYTYTGCGTDESLTEKGVEQANKCALTLSQLQREGKIGKISAIYSSTLKRAVETAKPIAETLGLDVRRRQDLREISWGSADGQLVNEMTEKWDAVEKQVKQIYPDRKVRWDHLPVFDGAETYNVLLSRTLTELKTLADVHPNETIVIIGHGRVLKTLIADARNSEENIPYPANCGIAEFTYSAEEGLRFQKIL